MPRLGQQLHVTAPHGQHRVTYIDDEDHDDPRQRLYGIEDAIGTNPQRMGFTGEELDSLMTWWAKERARRPAPQPLPVLGDPSTNPDLDPDRLRADMDEVGGL